jgi:hypothetical protein
MAFDGKNKVFFRQSISISGGFLTCLIMVYLSHVFLTPSNPESFNPAETCTSPPLGCWDALTKPAYQCMKYDVDTYIRPGVIFKQGTTNCYKSMYINLDGNSLKIMFWLFFWFTITLRTSERAVMALLTGKIEPIVLFALLLSLPVGWYAASVIIHYLNDRYFVMYSSQMYFTLTEFLSIVVLGMHVNRGDSVNQMGLQIVGGTALAHFFQLLLDEQFLIKSSPAGTLRNSVFALNDIVNFYVSWKLIEGQTNRRKLTTFATCGLVQLIFFHFFMADFASFKLSSA